MTRQYQHQQRLDRAGKCQRCGKKRQTRYRFYCNACAIKVRISHRRLTHSAPWQHGHRGRPPFIKDPSCSP